MRAPSRVSEIATLAQQVMRVMRAFALRPSGCCAPIVGREERCGEFGRRRRAGTWMLQKLQVLPWPLKRARKPRSISYHWLIQSTSEYCLNRKVYTWTVTSPLKRFCSGLKGDRGRACRTASGNGDHRNTPDKVQRPRTKDKAPKDDPLGTASVGRTARMNDNARGSSGIQSASDSTPSHLISFGTKASVQIDNQTICIH